MVEDNTKKYQKNKLSFIYVCKNCYKHAMFKTYLFAYIAPNQRISTNFVKEKTKLDAIKLFYTINHLCEIIAITELTEEEIKEIK